ncbi:MAG: hypothetical protein MRJ96_13615 [Nitrospirales bacterium]|nr:hypothetical protein [Nitrospirales bacterium]
MDDVTDEYPLKTTQQPLLVHIKRSLDKEHVTQPSSELDVSPSAWEYDVLQRNLEKLPLYTPIIDNGLLGSPERLVKITLRYDYAGSYGHQGWCEVSWMTGGIIPCYGTLSVHDVEYTVYIKGTFKKRYTYQYKQIGAYWILLLPFVWLNAFTDSREDALATTFHQFLAQSHADGVL